MSVKSYFVNAAEDGIAMARQEWGPDAMLVNSRKSSPETGHLTRSRGPILNEGVRTGEPLSFFTAG